MQLVSIETFISIVYGEDDHPPSVSTIRRRCPTIPGAFRDGRRWRIDLDVYFEAMRNRIVGGGTCERKVAFAMEVARRLG